MLSEKVATLTTQLAKAKQALENSAGAEARLTQAVGDAEKKHSATVDMYEEKLSNTEQRELEAETSTGQSLMLCSKRCVFQLSTSAVLTPAIELISGRE